MMRTLRMVKGTVKALFDFKENLKTVYDNLKIKHKLFLVQYLIVFSFGGMSLIGIQITLNLYDGLLYSESAKVLNLSTVNIENELQQIEKVSFTILSHPDIQHYLKRLQAPRNAASDALIRSALTEILWVYLFERNVVSVNLIDSHGKQYSGGPPIRGEMVKAIIARTEASHGSAVFIEPFPGDHYLICARQVREVSRLSLKPLGTLIIRVNMAGLVRHSTAGAANHAGNLLIRAGNKEIFASGPLAKKLEGKKYFQKNRGYQVEKIDGRSFFVAHTVSPTSGWTYINILPYDRIFKPIIMMRTVVIIIFGVLLAGTVFLSMHIARTITRPIENLTAQMKRVEQGEFTIDEQALPEVGRADEIGDLQRDFTIMIQKINALIQEDYTKQIVIKDTQFRALQAQINPHFLYNTMESINWLAKLNGEQEISQMVEALGNLLRSSISNQESVITIEQEMSLLQDYITIQQMRFGERLQFKMEIPPQWRKLPIPKLILQPIVENAIRYGLEELTGICQIHISAREDGDALEILVADNGPGMDEDLQKQWEQGEFQPRGTGIGLKNINDRLRLIFGDSYGISLTSRPGEGTQVHIRIPKEEGPHV